MWRICTSIVITKAINTMAMTFCKTMNTFESTILLRKRKAPVTTSMGLARDTTMAGIKPANSATTTTMSR